MLVKQGDLDKLITPARAKKEEDSWEKELERLRRPLTKEEQEKGLAALEAVKKLSAEMIKRRGGKLFLILLRSSAKCVKNGAGSFHDLP